MDELVINLEDILNLSKKKNIPIQNLLSGFFLEYILELFFQINWNKKIFVKNLNTFGLIQYKEKIQNCLSLCSDVNELELKEKVKEIFENNQVFDFTFRMNTKNNLEVNIIAKWDRYEIPMKVIIYPLDEYEIFPNEKTLESSFVKGKQIDYLAYPVEIQLTNNIFHIIEKLELITDMEAYDNIYFILSNYTIDGRKIYQLIGESFFDIDLFEKSFHTVIGYKDYMFMKKKWKSYHKILKREIVPWEDIILLVDTFFSPIFNAIKRDTVFFGDWMPNLKRFLD